MKALILFSIIWPTLLSFSGILDIASRRITSRRFSGEDDIGLALASVRCLSTMKNSRSSGLYGTRAVIIYLLHQVRSNIRTLQSILKIPLAAKLPKKRV